MAIFDGASDTAEFALRFHHEVRTAQWERIVPQVTVEIDLGETIVLEGDLVGDAVNMASRVMSVDFGIGVLADRSLLRQHDISEAGFTESLLMGNESSRTGTRLYQPPEAAVGNSATVHRTG